MFRELRFGLGLYLSALAGAALGYLWVSFPHVRSDDIDAEAREAAVMAVIGAIAGSAAWLTYKYSRQQAPKS